MEFWASTATLFSAILQYSCDHDLCRAAKARSECTDLAANDNEAMTVLLLRRDGWVMCNNITKFVLKPGSLPSDDLTRWVVDCRRMLRVELPAEDGGTDDT